MGAVFRGFGFPKGANELQTHRKDAGRSEVTNACKSLIYFVGNNAQNVPNNAIHGVRSAMIIPYFRGSQSSDSVDVLSSK